MADNSNDSDSNDSVQGFLTELKAFASRLAQADSVLVITGAGMSADSGLPTYRGVGGLYEDKDTEDGVPIEVALSGPVFRKTPEITWKYLGQIEKGTRGKTFNRGHSVLAEMEQHFQRFWILTQNVDGFHTFAGSKNVIEIHGNLHNLECTACDHRKTVMDYVDIPIPPICDRCQAMMRPSVVLFEESLPQDALETLDREHRVPFDIVISIGTSSHFPYIVQPVIFAKQVGSFTVEINPGSTSISDVVDLQLPLGAADVLDHVWKLVGASS